MAIMNAVTVLMQWIHIASVAVAVGGIFMLRFIACPALRETIAEDESARSRLTKAIVGRFRIVVHSAIALLLISGLYLLFGTPSIGLFRNSAAYRYGLETKVMLALALFFISIMLTLKRETPNTFQRNRDRWLLINFVLALVIILIASFLRRMQ